MSRPPLLHVPPTGLPVARFRLTARVTGANLRLPDYSGSLLRGVLGAAFRRIVCMTRLPACGDCPALRNCAYPAMFEPPRPPALSLRSIANVPVPYVVEPWPPLPRQLESGAQFSFSVVLLGRGLTRLPLWIMAAQRALSEGLGRERVTCELIAVDAVHSPHPLLPVWRAPVTTEPASDRAPIQDPPAAFIPPAWHPPAAGETAADLCLSWLTPLRLQENGRILSTQELDPHRLVMAVARRASLLFEAHADTDLRLAFARAGDEAERLGHEIQMRRRDWTRYSSRQQREMQMSGQVGRWTLRGVSPELRQLLALGELLHAGKGAVFGLGHYRIDPA